MTIFDSIFLRVFSGNYRSNAEKLREKVEAQHEKLRVKHGKRLLKKIYREINASVSKNRFGCDLFVKEESEKSIEYARFILESRGFKTSLNVDEKLYVSW
jgi:hypothetical protein